MARLQTFYQAIRFNRNIAAWNVMSVTTFAGNCCSCFSQTGLSCAIKSGLYTAWGGTFRNAFPNFSSSSACTESPTWATPTPTPSPTFFLAATTFSPLNAPVSHGAVLTILGTGFGTANESPSAYVSEQPCATTSWTTATQLICAASALRLASGAASAPHAQLPARSATPNCAQALTVSRNDFST